VKDIKYLLALNAHEKIGSQTIKKILSAFSELEIIWQGSEAELSKRLEPKIVSLIIEAKKHFNPDRELEKILTHGIGYVTIFDKDYPPQLKEIYDAPALLYVKGNITALKLPSISVVGSRKYTIYGKRIAKALVKDCVNGGLSIVSGLALGIDGEAHRTALENEGITVAVLGCGLDNIYPSNHRNLAHEIIEKNGALISEYSPGTPALSYNFPARNRIIAGLSLGTLVIEAGEKSGTLITAECALEYNREVFAVPGNIDADSSKGTNLLIQKGAKLILSAEDIFSELPIEVKFSQQKAKEILPESKEEKIILEILSNGEKLVDQIIALSKLNIIVVNSVLTMMEMKGMIENIGGGRYRKIC
jgi:DNA processing protein